MIGAYNSPCMHLYIHSVIGIGTSLNSVLLEGGTYTVGSVSVRCMDTRRTCTGEPYYSNSIICYICPIYCLSSVCLVPGTMGEEVVSGGEDSSIRVWRG